MDKQKRIPAKLKIQLLADELVVAESESHALWSDVLQVIAAEDSGQQGGIKERFQKGGHPGIGNGGIPASLQTNTPLSKFASQTGIEQDALEGACSPSTEAPFIHLESRYWEALKKNTPQRGPNAVAPIALAGTMLAMWFKHANIEGSPTVAQAQAVLSTIDTRDKNPGRSLKNCTWLRNRSGAIMLNPAEVSKAISVMKAYCTQTSPDVSPA